MYFFIFIIFFILVIVLAFNGIMLRQDRKYLENFICPNCLNYGGKNEPCDCAGYKNCKKC